MGILMRIASALSVALLLLIGSGSAPAGAAASASTLLAQGASIGRQIGQQAATQARIATSRVRQSGGMLRVPLRGRDPIVVQHTVESYSAAVFDRASSMVQRHFDDSMPIGYVRFVIQRACAHEEMKDRAGEDDALQATYDAISDLPGKAALAMRIVALARDMNEADTPSDAVGIGAAAFICEVA